MNIEEMKDWDILTYLRINRNWMVQSHYSREDIESMYGLTLSDDDWCSFTEHACDAFDYVKEDVMDLIVETFEEKLKIRDDRSFNHKV